MSLFKTWCEAKEGGRGVSLTVLRPVLKDPLDDDGHFALPKEFTAADEVRWAKRRQDSIRVAHYADSKCGLPSTFDPDGGYLCGTCNKYIDETKECLIRRKLIDDPAKQSCGLWEAKNAGNPEGQYCPKNKKKMDDGRIGFGETKNKLGFSCERCEYGQQKMVAADSQGRTNWCNLKGHPVELKACCGDNEPK
jgi:hypothetical protein